VSLKRTEENNSNIFFFRKATLATKVIVSKWNLLQQCANIAVILLNSVNSCNSVTHYEQCHLKRVELRNSVVFPGMYHLLGKCYSFKMGFLTTMCNEISKFLVFFFVIIFCPVVKKKRCFLSTCLHFFPVFHKISGIQIIKFLSL